MRRRRRTGSAYRVVVDLPDELRPVGLLQGVDFAREHVDPIPLLGNSLVVEVERLLLQGDGLAGHVQMNASAFFHVRGNVRPMATVTTPAFIERTGDLLFRTDVLQVVLNLPMGIHHQCNRSDRARRRAGLPVRVGTRRWNTGWDMAL